MARIIMLGKMIDYYRKSNRLTLEDLGKSWASRLVLLANGCQAKRINMLVAEKAVLNELEKLRLDPSLITDESGIIDTDYINLLESDISVIDDQLNRLVDLYLDGYITR